MSEPAPLACAACGTQLPAGALFCPSCQRLVHMDRLRELNQVAEAAQARGAWDEARDAWRTATELLPPGSRQQAVLRARIDAMREASDADPGTPRPAPSKRAGVIGSALTGVALLAWKLKTVLLLLLGKGKLLLVGLTKGKTLFTMLAFLGVYWTMFGWQFAVGIVASIYVHEMGHVYALNRLGIRASAPMFVPGFGAYVRLEQYPASPVEEARVGLAGPLWGLSTAVVCFGVYQLTGSAVWAAVAHVGAWINMFNLVPVWQLDGSRGFVALSRVQRGGISALAVVLGVASFEPMLWIVGAVGAWRTWTTPAGTPGHGRTAIEFAGLLGALTAVLLLSQVTGLP